MGVYDMAITTQFSVPGRQASPMGQPLLYQPAPGEARLNVLKPDTLKFSAQTRPPHGPRHTGIIATIGTSCDSPEMIQKLIEAGTDTFRLNFAQGTHQQHATRIDKIRDVVTQMKQAGRLSHPVDILVDIQGPRLEVGTLLNGTMTLNEGGTVRLSKSVTTTQADVIPTTYPDLIDALRPGHHVLLDDGKLEVEVLHPASASPDQTVSCRILRGGTLTNGRGMNVPDVPLKTPALTEKDQHDLDFALSKGVDLIALSFVQSDQDVRDTQAFAKARGKNLKIISKIERPQSVETGMLRKIIQASDGVMVARGDLGIEMGILDLPRLQKRIIHEARELGKPVVVANQLLTSMVSSEQPNRSNVFDIVDAIEDGADVLMLTAETGEGRFPVQAVQTVESIIRQYEPMQHHAQAPGISAKVGNWCKQVFQGIARCWQQTVSTVSGWFSTCWNSCFKKKPAA